MRRGNRAHSGETSKPRTAYEPHQDCLRLIVHRVSDGDSITSGLAGDIHQEFISQFSRYFFDSSLRRFGDRTNVNRTDRRRYTKPLSQSPHELSVLRRLAPSQHVIEMGNVKMGVGG
jgi:hypothetical protein